MDELLGADLDAAEITRVEILKSTAWDRAERARQTRVPHTEFATDEERTWYAWAMDSQRDMVKWQNPNIYGGKS